MKRHQIKSSWYYIFWGITAVAVLTGQIYVGAGYRIMAETISGLKKSCAPTDMPGWMMYSR
jgi:hypothetical protein